MKKLLYGVLCLVLGGPLWAQTARLSHYTLNLHYQPEYKRILGEEKVRIYNTFQTPQTRFYFTLDNDQEEANPHLSSLAQTVMYSGMFKPAPITITQVRGNHNQPLTIQFLPSDQGVHFQKFSQNHSLFYIEVLPVQPGDYVDLSMEFIVTLPDLKQLSDRALYDQTALLRFGWYPREVYRQNGQWTVTKNILAPSIIDTTTVTTPLGYTPILAGENPTTQQTPTLTMSTTTHDKAGKSQALMISPEHRKVSVLSEQGYTVEVWISAENTDSTRALSYAQYAANTLDTYTTLYGALPYKRVVLVEAPQPGIWGMASDGFVFLGNHFFSTADILSAHYFDPLHLYVIAHELAHLWAGIGSGVDFLNENYLSEGLADFMAVDYFENKFGRYGNLAQPQARYYQWISALLHGYVIPPGSFSLRDLSQYHYLCMTTQTPWDQPLLEPISSTIQNSDTTRLYDKGQGVFRMLSKTVGPLAFQKALHTYFNTTRLSAGSTPHLKTAFEGVSSHNISQFFSDWIEHSSQTDLFLGPITTTAASSNYVTRVPIQKEGMGIVPLDIELHLQNGSSSRQTLYDFEGSKAVFFTTQSPVIGVTVDPDSDLLEINKHNNSTLNKTDILFLASTEFLEKRRPLQHSSIGFFPFISGGDTGLYGGFTLKESDALTHELEIGATGSSAGPIGHFGATFYLKNKARFSNYLSGSSDYLWAESTYKVPLFFPVETGYDTQVLDPLWTLSFSGAILSAQNTAFNLRKTSLFGTPYFYAIDSVTHPEYFLSISALYNSIGFHDQLIKLSITKGFASQSDLQTELEAFQMIHLLDSLFLGLTLKGGVGLDTDHVLKFQQPHINRFADSDAETFGDSYLGGSLDLLCPLFTAKWPILGLFVFKGLTGNLYLEGGTLTNPSTQFQDFYTGIELASKFTTLGDFPFTFGIGIGRSIQKAPSESPTLYFFVSSLASLFSLYTTK